MEEWRILIENENYSISNFGSFKSKRKLLKQNINARGYKYCNISTKGIVTKVKIHRLVAKYFVNNTDKDKVIVNHKDLNKLNNHYNNLEWTTQKENVHHYFKNKN